MQNKKIAPFFILDQAAALELAQALVTAKFVRYH